MTHQYTTPQTELEYKLIHDGLAIHKGKEYAGRAINVVKNNDKMSSHFTTNHVKFDDVMDTLRILSSK